jgi:hypothetical protein
MKAPKSLRNVLAAVLFSPSISCNTSDIVLNIGGSVQEAYSEVISNEEAEPLEISAPFKAGDFSSSTEEDDTGIPDSGHTESEKSDKVEEEEQPDPAILCTSSNGDSDGDCFTDSFEKKEGTDPNGSTDFPERIPVEIIAYEKLYKYQISGYGARSGNEYDEPESLSFYTDETSLFETYTTDEHVLGLQVEEGFLGKVTVYECDAYYSSASFPNSYECEVEATIITSFDELGANASSDLSSEYSFTDAIWASTLQTGAYAGFRVELER